LGTVARFHQGTLRSSTVGALPIVNQILKRMNLEEILEAHLPPQNRRCKLPVARGLLLLVKNLLLSREPIYGLGEWAARYDPAPLGLSPEQVLALNDDRAGRCLSVFFHCDRPAVVLEVVRHVVREFTLGMDELHNDSTSVSFFGAYAEAAEETLRRNQKTLAITWGHSKDHRPDLKQLLYILTISNDGGVPVHFRAASGNVTDDTTHRENWDLLCQIAGRRDFLYVADCKLATIDNMNYIAGNGGRFVSVLPRTRKEDAAFRTRTLHGEVVWQPLWDKTDDQGQLVDSFSVCDKPVVLPEGYCLWWFHSTRKAELDLATRSGRLARAEQQLRQLHAGAPLAAVSSAGPGQGAGRGGRDSPSLRGERMDSRTDRPASTGNLPPAETRATGKGHRVREGGLDPRRFRLHDRPRTSSAGASDGRHLPVGDQRRQAFRPGGRARLQTSAADREAI